MTGTMTPSMPGTRPAPNTGLDEVSAGLVEQLGRDLFLESLGARVKFVDRQITLIAAYSAPSWPKYKAAVIPWADHAAALKSLHRRLLPGAPIENPPPDEPAMRDHWRAHEALRAWLEAVDVEGFAGLFGRLDAAITKADEEIQLAAGILAHAIKRLATDTRYLVTLTGDPNPRGGPRVPPTGGINVDRADRTMQQAFLAAADAETAIRSRDQATARGRELVQARDAAIARLVSSMTVYLAPNSSRIAADVAAEMESRFRTVREMTRQFGLTEPNVEQLARSLGLTQESKSKAVADAVAEAQQAIPNEHLERARRGDLASLALVAKATKDKALPGLLRVAVLEAIEQEAVTWFSL